MKKLFTLALLLVSILFITSCSKDSAEPAAAATTTVDPIIGIWKYTSRTTKAGTNAPVTSTLTACQQTSTEEYTAAKVSVMRDYGGNTSGNCVLQSGTGVWSNQGNGNYYITNTANGNVTISTTFSNNNNTKTSSFADGSVLVTLTHTRQ